MKIVQKIVLISSISFTTLMACGSGNYNALFSKDNYYNFLDASLVGVDNENPLYALTSSGSAYSYDKRVEYYKGIKRELNVKEWYGYLGGKLSEEELNDLLYRHKGSLMTRYEKYKSKVNDAAFERYLNSIASTTESAIEQEEDRFLKLRYLFLNMRKAHYAKNYKKTLALYEQHQASVSDVQSIVHEWIDALRAGAMQHLGQTVASNLLYAKVLEHKTNAHLGYYDFKIENDAEWQALLAKAKNGEEKAKFYFLRALKWEGSPLMEHEAMAKVAPQSLWFERLTYMLMQDFQESAYDYETRDNKENRYVEKERRIYLLKEQHFLKTLASLENPSFFTLYSSLYLRFLREGELDKKDMNRLTKMANKNEQVFVKILNYLHDTVHLTKAKQETLFSTLNTLSKEVSPTLEKSLFSYTALHNVNLYPEMSAKRIYAKIFADNSHYTQYHLSRDAILAESFEQYVEEKNRNSFEEKLFRKSMKRLAKNGVAETLAILYIKDGNFQKAQKYLDQVPNLNRRTEFNPFNTSLSGNNRKKKGKGYDQRKFVKVMLKLEESLKKNPKLAMDHFLYAIGRYNSSWFGNFTESGSIWRTLKGFGEDEAKHILKNYLDIEQSYRLALKYAKEEEFKAEIAYELLKVKLAQEVLVPNLGVSRIAFGRKGWGERKSLREEVEASMVLKDAYGEYKKKYQDTQYGKEIIGRCVTFSYF